MLLEMEEILQSFRPEVSLYEYQQELKDQVTEKIAQQNENPEPRTHFMDKTQELRPELRRIHDAPYFNAGLQMPKKEYLDFIDSRDEFLPWPVAPGRTNLEVTDFEKERDPIAAVMEQLAETEKSATPEWYQCFAMREGEEGKTGQKGNPVGAKQPRQVRTATQQRPAKHPSKAKKADKVVDDMVEEAVDKAVSFLAGIFKRR